MAGLPALFLRHTATIEPFEGAGPAGPLFGTPVLVRCFADDQRRMIRGDNGTEVVSNTTLYCPLMTVAPPESRVTVNGRAVSVLAAYRRDGGGLPTPDHLELALT
ncbi:hypothetical protein [Amycolatopsis sp. H20-H5]|uniref:hypothetical protein n=1 Tax=Amycolatopsis sp. H20-H5 TaxID=3046309 RepID=UPI002DB96C59|nr:hypothetical protein [Amycolatopsis sp. H20-H5]MEC3977902.1 hypothetical protein [Amycolatopsis sp. H20-H5]